MPASPSNAPSPVKSSSSPRHLLLALKSPLQAINAIEYYHSADHIPIASVTAIIFGPRAKHAIHTITADLLRAHIPEVSIHITPGVPFERSGWHGFREERKRALAFSRRLRALLATTAAPTEVLLGDYRSRECRHVSGLRIAHGARLVLLDDGSATHQIARFRTDPAAPNLSPLFPRLDTRTLRLRIWDVRLPFIKHATFFTHYDIACPPQDALLRHTYSYWRSRLDDRTVQTTGDVLLLGMSHVEKRLTRLDRYLAAMAAIKAHYRDEPVLYRPHRDETPDKLAHIEQLGFTLAPSLLPVEIQLLQATRLPREIASIASSALDNLALLFGEKLKLRCFEPAPDYCNPELSAHFNDIVRYHRKNLHRNMTTTVLAEPAAPAGLSSLSATL